MDNQNILYELLSLLEQKNIEIRKEPLQGSGGGLCSVKGRYLFFLDTQAPTTKTAPLAAKAVAKLVNTDNIYIKPQVREFIQLNAAT